MGDRRFGIIARRTPVHERAGTKRGLTHRTAIDKQASTVGQVDVHPRGQFHEQIMRMLAIDQWLPARCFSGREQIGIAAAVHCRLEAEHRFQLDLAPASFLFGRDHPHRGDIEFVIPARTGGFGILRRCSAVDHHHPVIAGHEMEAVHCALVAREARSARTIGVSKLWGSLARHRRRAAAHVMSGMIDRLGCRSWGWRSHRRGRGHGRGHRHRVPAMILRHGRRRKCCGASERHKKGMFHRTVLNLRANALPWREWYDPLRTAEEVSRVQQWHGGCDNR